MTTTPLSSAAASLARAPDHVRAVAGVDHLTWGSESAETVLLVPGWGAHPRYYGNLIATLVEHGYSVRSSWPSGSAGRASSAAHYTRLAADIDELRRSDPASCVRVVAESLGATFALASRALRQADAAVFVSPGLFLRTRQIATRQAVSDVLRLISTNRLPLLGWRLDSVSDNESFTRAVRLANLGPPYSNRRYVLTAAAAVVSAILRPVGAGRNLIISGGRDRLLNPVGGRYLAWRLCSAETDHRTYPTAPHGVLWDASVGDLAATQIAGFLRDG